ncbi:MAG: ADP-L-glycero-D-manno-heptose-6-epimerase [Candidatus Portnoybacteria bacterium RBG_13_41_18]|uniref:ADP-L-glycero-D-manno-heptose-6-epimerase n=1 Tax=Candidatus Portnoybacteria bacterium RBG_13_41_18 TaxID=1801991 RepID=A0A1G2F6I5_9BACT|nr:MAG: ADP-L-glycero-D-manno-heptose-6-epimerase [Candidatus Portnoybacteria bacterium RBG_13_41_18]
MKKTILVTGGAGFIGSHLCERLVKDKSNKIISLDNYFTGLKKNHVKGVQYRNGHTKDIERYIKETPDIVYHLGEYSRVEKSFDDVGLVWNLNKAGTFGVLEFCRKRNVKIVYAGSSTKFSDGGLGRDQSPYAWTKASNTELVRNYGLWFNLSHAITYFYNVYGPREISVGLYATVIGIFKELYRQGKPLTVVLPGTQERNFTHIDDIVSGLVLVGNDGEGDDFGIGSEKSYTILEVAKMFNSKIEMLPARKGNRMQSAIDTSKIRSLGWEPKNDLATHIKNFISSIRHS